MATVKQELGLNVLGQLFCFSLKLIFNDHDLFTSTCLSSLKAFLKHKTKTDHRVVFKKLLNVN